MRRQNWPNAAKETRLATLMLVMLAYGARARRTQASAASWASAGGFLFLTSSAKCSFSRASRSVFCSFAFKRFPRRFVRGLAVASMRARAEAARRPETYEVQAVAG